MTASPQAPASSPGTATGTPAAPGGPAPCPTRSLGLKPGLSQGAAGSVYQVLDFTNISNVSCTLYGYPGVSLAGGDPVKHIGLAADENPNPPRKLVTLAPGAVRPVTGALVRTSDDNVSRGRASRQGAGHPSIPPGHHAGGGASPPPRVPPSASSLPWRL